MTTQELINYYGSLLILQYLQGAKASATVKALASAAIMPQASLSDPTLPLAVQDGFNLIGASPAIGAQLDILGKYVGVTRTGNGFQGQIITLSDADFLTMVQLATITNTSTSDLASIQKTINTFFPGTMLVFDYQNMQMSYLLSSVIGSQNLIQLIVQEHLLPKPMGVSLSNVIYAPIINAFFGFVTYQLPTQPAITRPFNNYTSYQTNWPFVSYANAVV